MSKAPVSVKPTIAPPKNWRWSPIQAVARLESGHTPSRRRPEYWGGDIPWLSLKDIQELRGAYVYETADMPTALGIENSSARVLPKGTVALCRTASVGKVAILGRDMATSQDFVDWVCGAELHPEYLFWALRASSATFDLEKQGSTHKTIYMPVLERLQILLPPIDEQRRIAAILDKADAIRRKRREALALTEQLLRSTFLEMFGDPIKNSKDWPLVVISDLGNVITGNTPSRSDSDNFGSGIEWIKSDNITSASFYVDEASERLSELGAERARIAPSGSVLITCIAGSLSCIGNVALTNRDVAFNQQINAIVPNEIQAAPFIYMQTLLMKEVLQAESTGGMKGMLSKGRLSSIKYIQPPRPQIHDFGRRFDSCWSQHRRIQESAHEADGLLESLTYRAFTGQL